MKRLSLPLALSGLALGACAQEPIAPPGSNVKLTLAPLTLPGIQDACYTLEVQNDVGQTVWRQEHLCSSQYGDGIGALTYIGPCDAQDNDDPSDGTAMNTVTLTLENLYTATANPNDLTQGAVPDASWNNPCSYFADGSLVDPNGDGYGPCQLTFDCKANADVLVEFNVTIMRSANQGFFDIAVNFEDVFCSAKLDTCYDPDSPITLLHKPDGTRGPTAVLALACTGGPGKEVDSHLHMTSIVIDCPEPFEDIVLDPTAGPGNAWVFGDETTDPDPDDAVYQYAVYEGREELECDDETDCNKIYWNFAIGLDPSALPAGCFIRASATASDGGFAVDGEVTGTLPSASIYPVITFATALTTEAGLLDCAQDGLDGGGGVSTGYSGLDGCGPTFCHYGNGDESSSVDAAAYALYAEALGDLAMSYDAFCAQPVSSCCLESYLSAAEALGLGGSEGRGVAPASVPMGLHDYCAWGEPCVQSYLAYAEAEATPDAFDADWIAANCVSVSGQLVLESEVDEAVVPVAFARIVATPAYAPRADALIMANKPVEVLTDADGFYRIPSFPSGVEYLRLDTYIDGELAGSGVVALANGGRAEQDIVVERGVLVLAAAICVGYQWNKARKVQPPSSTPNSLKDKFRHCYASCRSALHCTVPAAWTAGLLKETLDELCSHGPAWLKKLLKKVSACGGWDAADMLANNRGISCTKSPYNVSSNSGCYSCCDTWY